MSELLFASNTAGTPTAPTTTDASIITFNVKPNSYNAARIRVDYEITTSGTSGTNTNTIKIKQGTATIKTQSFKTDAVARILPLSIEYVGDISAGGAFTTTIAVATSNDPNTTYKVTSVYVHSIQ